MNRARETRDVSFVLTGFFPLMKRKLRSSSSAEVARRVSLGEEPGSILVTSLLESQRELARRAGALVFPPDLYVYNALDYAWMVHEAFIRKYARSSASVLMMGINPGPFGMAQTGVPFGDVEKVRGYLQLDCNALTISKPAHEHPARPILGWQCPRSEVSGSRLWSWAESSFGPADKFFDDIYVHNWCPLAFVQGPNGRNLTPDRIKADAETIAKLFDVCDEALIALLRLLQPRVAIGVGGFAATRLRKAIQRAGDERVSAIEVCQMLHPSPANPKANRNWSASASQTMSDIIHQYQLSVPLPRI